MMALTPECASGVWLWLPFAALVVVISVDVYLWRGVRKGSLTITSPALVKTALFMMHIAAVLGMVVLLTNRMVCQ